MTFRGKVIYDKSMVGINPAPNAWGDVGDRQQRSLVASGGHCGRMNSAATETKPGQAKMCYKCSLGFDIGDKVGYNQDIQKATCRYSNAKHCGD